LITSFRKNKKTRKTFPVREPLIEVVKTGAKIHPFNVQTRLKDGRKFELRVNALSEEEAVGIVKDKFPLATITKLKRADRYSTVRKILWELRPPGIDGA
jgi:hypothetical protein